MKLNHLNLTVTDVTATCEFLEKYFDLKRQVSRGDTFAIVSDDNGMVFTLMKGAEVNYPKMFHIGFIQENEEKVNEINHRLKTDGFDVKAPQRSHGYTFYVKAPGGILVEVLALN